MGRAKEKCKFTGLSAQETLKAFLKKDVFKLGHEMNGAARGKNRSVMELYIVYILIFLKASPRLGSVILWCRC